MSRDRYSEYDPATREYRIGNQWYDVHDIDARERERDAQADTARDMELETDDADD